MTNTTATKWWWNKKAKPTTTITKAKSIASSLNGADENASMFSLYSYNNTDYCPSSLYATQHTKSEYSGNFSDVESNVSILSKPWISRNLYLNKEKEIKQEDAEEDDDSVDDNNQAYSAPPMTNCIADSRSFTSSLQPIPPKRRSSIVGYIVNKPLHGKIKAGFGKFMGRNQSEELTLGNNRRRSYG